MYRSNYKSEFNLMNPILSFFCIPVLALFLLSGSGCANRDKVSGEPQQAQTAAAEKYPEIFSDMETVCAKMAAEMNSSAMEKVIVADFYYPVHPEGISDDEAALIAEDTKSGLSAIFCRLETCDAEFSDTFTDFLAVKKFTMEQLYSFVTFNWIQPVKDENSAARYVLLGKIHPRDDAGGTFLEIAIFDMNEYKSATSGKVYLSH